MSIQVICTPYGPPAAKRLGEQIDALKGGNPLAPVTAVVPTNIAGLAARRALGARGHGIAAVSFLNLSDLAKHLAGQQMAEGPQRKRLSDLVVGAAMRAALADEPGVFCASAHHTATEQALIRSYRDLRGVSRDSLDRLAAQSGRAGDLVRLCRQVRRELQPRWYDEQDLYDQAIAGLRSGSPSTIVDELGPVIVYLPQRVGKSQGQVISALADTASVVVVAGLTGDDQADAPVLESVHRMGGSVDAAAPTGTSYGQRIISAASADEEVRIAIREVVRAARDGVSLGRIAVLCGGGLAAVRQVQDQLAAAAIPFSGPSGRTLADTLLGRGILALLSLRHRGFRRDEVFALLSVAAPILPGDENTASDQPKPAPVMAWERISRRAGVSRGADQWHVRLSQYAAQLYSDADTEQGDPDYVGERANRLRREAGHAESLAQFMAALVSDLSPDPAPTTWSRWCRWVERLINTYLGDEASREDWPEAEKEAGKALQKTLARLASLDEVEGNPPVTAFLPALASELGAPTGRIGRIGRGVLTGSIGESLGLDLDRLIVIGLAEGMFPRSPSDDPLLPDKERQAAGDDLDLLGDQLGDQHRSLLAALAFSRSATLVYARGDSRRSAPQHPSRWLLDTAAKLAGHRVEGASLEGLANNKANGWFEHVSSFSSRVANSPLPATSQEFRLKALTAGGQTAEGLRHEDPILSRGAALVEARASSEFTRFDGNLTGVAKSGPTQAVLSPTSLETWADCPMRYLFRHVLQVQALDQPEELLEITPQEKGSLVHKALDRFLAEQLEKEHVPQPGQPWSESQRDRLQGIGEEECNEAESKGLTGTPVYWHHNRGRILADLDRFLVEDNQRRRQHGTTPLASELEFGMPGDDQGAIEVELPDDRRVRFRGRADRVDRGADNSLLVTDYKTGKADAYRGLDEGSKDWDPVQRGTRLQLPVYGLAARDRWDSTGAPVRAQYWFVTEEGDFKTHGYLLDERVIDRFCEAVAVVAEGIEAGMFCDRPQPGQSDGQFSQRCEFCNADRLGTEDNRRKWERMMAEDKLADYRKLAEPPGQNSDDEAI